jgi:hypothetical protein
MLKIIATLCSLAAPGECHDVVVASGQPMQACTFAQLQIADWMRNEPSLAGYRLARYRCDIGDRGA